MFSDPNVVQFTVWFIPETGIDQPPSQLGTARGPVGAAIIARNYMDRDFQEPDDYGVMYNESRAELARWLGLGPKMWSVALPVHYGTIVIA